MRKYQIVNAAKYMAEHGSFITQDGHCHFDFEDIGNLVGETLTDKHKQSIRSYALEKYAEAVREITLENGFEFIFNPEFCPNIGKEPSV